VPLASRNTTEQPMTDGAMVVGAERDASLVPGDVRVDVVAVQPDQVAGVVRWNEGLADRPLDELMDALANYEGDRVPVVLAGPVPDAVVNGTDGALTLDFNYYTMPVEVVGRADAFPGQGSRDALLVADFDSYVAGIEAANRDPDLVMSREAWARGEASDVLDRLVAGGYTVPDDLEDVETSAAFADRPELHAQTWSLAYLRAVALAAGVLGLVGVAMHAVSQQRRRTSAGLLLARMGMSRRSADVSAGLEIGLLTGLAGVVAILVALPASALVLRLLDPVPTLQPDALFAVPWASIGAVAAGVALVTAGGAFLVGRAARRATGGQVMRDAS
jgi:putative ABC transport system permease protein